MVAEVTEGLDPVRPYFSWRDMATCAVTPLGKTSSVVFRFSSTCRFFAPVRSQMTCPPPQAYALVLGIVDRSYHCSESVKL